MRKLVGLVFAALAAAMLLALSAGQALATTVHCGDTITQDTTLTSDVICPSPNDRAISLASDADHDNPFEPDLDVDPPNPPPIHLDLNGHTVVGGISGGNRFFPLDVDVEVRNGTVYGSLYGGVSLSWATTISVHDLRLHGGGIEVGRTSTATVVRNSVSDSQTYGMVFGHASVDAHDNTVVRTRGDGILGEIVHGSIMHNTSNDNEASGINIYEGDDLRVEGNTVERNHNGIEAESGTISGNDIRNSGNYGVVASGGQILDNQITGSASSGIFLGGGTITGNLVSGNGQHGIVIPSLTDATVTQNVIIGNRLDGIHDFHNLEDAYPYWPSPRILDNRVDGNGGDGIRTDSPNATLNNNHTWFNGNLGIEAVLFPDSDTLFMGLGNWAKHNGNPLQCVPATFCSTTGKPKG